AAGAALDGPSAGLVASAGVEAGRDVSVVADDVVVELETALECAFGRPPAALVEVAIPRVDEQRVVRRVELDVRCAETHELVDLLPQQLGDVGEEVLDARVRGGRTLGIAEVREEAWVRARHLR